MAAALRCNAGTNETGGSGDADLHHPGILQAKPSPQPAIRKAITRAIRWLGIDFLVWQHDGLLALDLSRAATQIGYEFIESGKLGFGGEIAIEVPHETDADRDIIEVIAAT